MSTAEHIGVWDGSAAVALDCCARYHIGTPWRETTREMMSKSFSLDSGKSGRDWYASRYTNALEHQAEWMRRGARQKVESVEILLRRNGIAPHSIVELGCGTGAVISALQRRGLAQEYYGVDYSAEAIEYLRSTSPGIHCAVADIMETPNPFDRESFDVVVVSHTVEHLEEPVAFLNAISRVHFEHLIVEVPLEDLFFGRIKALVKDRSRNSAGHVQFFSQRSFRRLIMSAMLNIVDERIYPSWFDRETLRFAYGEDGLVRNIHKLLTEHYLPRAVAPVWTRLYHAHHAVLCGKARCVKVEGGT